MGYDTYTSPLATRNAGPQMLGIFSPRRKFDIWRRIWLAVAEAQHATDPELVRADQIGALRDAVARSITDDEIRLAAEYETRLRHDVMAHVHALGDTCPAARPILHLGMTSQDVVCNADWVLQTAALSLIHTKTARLVLAFAEQAERHRPLATLAFTHYQPAQPTTVGRRAAQWGADVAMTADRVGATLGAMRPRGFKGATGTQAAFLAIFDGDETKVHAFEREAAQRLWAMADRTPPADDAALPLTAQTYPRVMDCFLLADLAACASVLHKIATDIRLLCNRKELDEPFETEQVGSSAMPYKRNPMRCERVCGLSRFVMNLAANGYDTAATQWLERTLDDSSNRRLSIPEAFLALDGALDLMHNIAKGLVVHEAMVRANLEREMPFLAVENILMAAVRAGGDRQDYHDLIRTKAQEAHLRVKRDGLDNDLLDRLRADGALHPPALQRELDWDELLDPAQYTGRAAEQVDIFIERIARPLRKQCGPAIAALDVSAPRV